jgi:hypothetical protein
MNMAASAANIDLSGRPHLWKRPSAPVLLLLIQDLNFSELSSEIGYLNPDYSCFTSVTPGKYWGSALIWHDRLLAYALQFNNITAILLFDIA